MKNKRMKAVAPAPAKKSKNRLFIIIIAALLAAALTVGAVFGIIAIVRESGAVASFEGVRISEGVANYLASTRKKDYMRYLGSATGIPASDTPEYWQTENKDGVSYAELLRGDVEKYIRQVVIGSYIYDMAGGLDSYDREYIDTLTSDILMREAEGDKERFNELSSPMGFDYDDFCRGTEMVYKYRLAASAIYGSDGSGLTTAEKEEYLATYSHVKLLFIRTKYEYATDSDGNYIIDGQGYVKYELSESDVASRVSDIEEIRSLIEGKRNGADAIISPEVMSTFINKYNSSDTYADTGYYLSPKSGFVYDSIYNQDPDFVEMSEKIAKSAFSADVGDYVEFSTDDGVGFIYKYEVSPGAYSKGELSQFFSDFISDAVDHFYTLELESLSPAVKIKDSFYKIDLVALPYNKSMFAI